MKRRITAVVAAFAIAVVAGFSITEAAKPRRVSSRGLMAVSPSPTVPFGTVYTVTGTGFKPGTWVVVNLEATCELGGIMREAAWYGMADASGAFTFNRTTSNCKGTYSLYATEGRSTTAPATFQVQ